jgi:hypothetical protein
MPPLREMRLAVTAYTALAAARAVDIALVGSGLATAIGCVVFAGAMLTQGEHSPNVNGLEYLAIFARPHGAGQPAADEAPYRSRADARAPIDMTPVGSIGGAPASVAGYALVAAQPDFAWVREGSRIFAVRPGDELPRLGRVGAILQREGRWVLASDAGVTLMSSGGARAGLDAPARRPFARRMIFGADE